MKFLLALYFAFNFLALVNEKQDWPDQAMGRGLFFKIVLFGTPMYAIAAFKDWFKKKS